MLAWHSKIWGIGESEKKMLLNMFVEKLVCACRCRLRLFVQVVVVAAVCVGCPCVPVVIVLVVRCSVCLLRWCKLCLNISLIEFMAKNAV